MSPAITTRDPRRDEPARPALDQPLPGERIRGLKPRFYEYSRFPAFSLNWLIGRTIMFAIVLVPFALMVALGNAFVLEDTAAALAVAGLFFVGFFSFTLLGPALATIVRYRRWSIGVERVAIVLALILGIVLSGFTDFFVSTDMKKRIETKVAESPLLDAKTLKEAKKREQSPAMMAMGLVTGFMIYGLFGGGIGLIAYWREPTRLRAWHDAESLRQVRGAKAESDLKLAMLQAQVEPHFLFNTLAAVRASLRHAPADAEAMIDALIDYLRATIPKLRADGPGVASTLGEQLDLAGHYLRLMQLRMGSRLTVHIDHDDALRNAAFPPMLLLSLVENAIKHGVEPKPGPVDVRIETRATADRLTVLVLDSGVGLSASTSGGGVGLANVREHLRARHGDHAQLDLQSRPEGGTVASMELPLTHT